MDQSSSGTLSGSTSMSDSSSLGGAQVQHVSEDALNRLVTAKDLMGKDVYGSDGEKIGSIDDIALGLDSSNQVAMQITQWKSEQSGGAVAGSTSETDTESASGSGGVYGSTGSSSGYTSGTTTGATGSTGSTTGRTGSTDATTDTSASSSTAQSSTDASTSTGALSSGTSSMDTSSAVGSSTWGASSGPAVLVSTGGLFSRSEGKYRVPLSELTWDAENERFTCQMTRAEFEQRQSGSSSETDPR